MATTNSGARGPKTPVLTVTRYDLVSSLMIALVTGLVIAVGALVVILLTNSVPETEFIQPLEIVDVAGGSLDGAENETLLFESPEEIRDDPAVEQADVEDTDIQETVENVIELSEYATQQVEQNPTSGDTREGELGSADGTGRRALGNGPGNNPGREQRWFVHFKDRNSLDEYAAQLDFFKIEMGVLVPGGKLVYLSNLSQSKPARRSVDTGENEKRLYMTRMGGSKNKADIALLKKLGVDAEDGVIFHFYPKETEQLLAKVEYDYRNRKATDIRRTYFVVRSQGADEYEFYVTSQLYYR